MQENKTRLPRLDRNVGTFERTVSMFAGTWMLYHAFKDKSWLEGSVAGYLIFRGATGHCAAYSAMGKHTVHGHSRNVNIQTTVRVNRPRNEVYAFWRRLENLPLFMKHIETITELDNSTSEWTAKLPGSLSPISWKSEIMKDEPGKLIGWQSLPKSDIYNAGRVDFTDIGNAATEVHAVISYRAPLGLAGEGVAKLLNPLFENVVREDIKSFKRIMEASKVVPVNEN